jgi:hypothetical protein
MIWRRLLDKACRCAAQHWRVLLLLLLFGLTVAGLTADTVRCLSGPLRSRNDEYLDRAIKEAATLMVPIGIAKATADVLEGSTITLEGGIVVANTGTSIEVGDVLQPMLDYLGIAWRILLLNIIFLTAVKYVLLGCGPAAATMFGVAVAAYLAHAVLALFTVERNWLRFTARRIGGMCLLAALLFWVLLPLTIFSASKLSEMTTEPLRRSMWQSFDRVGRVFNLKAFHRAEGVKAKADALRQKSLELMQVAGKTTADVATSVAKLAVVQILDGVVFPFLSLLFLIWLVRGTLYPALGLGPPGLARRDAASLSAWLAAARSPVPEPKPAPERAPESGRGDRPE